MPSNFSIIGALKQNQTLSWKIARFISLCPAKNTHYFLYNCLSSLLLPPSSSIVGTWDVQDVVGTQVIGTTEVTFKPQGELSVKPPVSSSRDLFLVVSCFVVRHNVAT